MLRKRSLSFCQASNIGHKAFRVFWVVCLISSVVGATELNRDFGFGCEPFLRQSEVRQGFATFNRRSRQFFKQNVFYSLLREQMAVELQSPSTRMEVRTPNGFVYRVQISSHSELVAVDSEGRERTVWSSKLLSRSGAYSIWEISLSPDSQKLLMKIGYHGDLDSFTYLVFDLPDGKVLDQLDSLPSLAEGEADVFWFNAESLVIAKGGSSATSYFWHRIGTASRREIRLEQFRGQEIVNLRIVDSWLFIEVDNGKKFVITPDRKTVVPIHFDFDQLNHILGVSGGALFVETRGSRNFGQILRFSLKDTSPTRKVAKWKIVVPEMRERIKFSALVDGKLVVVGADRQGRTLRVFDEKGNLLETAAYPDGASVPYGVVFDQNRFILKVGSQVRDEQEIVYHLASRKFDNLESLMRTRDFQYVTEVIEARSSDGTGVPVRIVRRADLDPQSAHPVFIGVYGGFDVDAYFSPHYDRDVLRFLEAGGIYVAPALRGGGEFGGSWHEQGRSNKQKTIEDLVATVEALRSKTSLSAGKIAVYGESNGALIGVSAAVQRPDLFDVVIAVNGPYDIIHLKDLDPIHDFSPEYGDPQIPSEFEDMKKYAPLLHVAEGFYPLFLFVVGEKDSRVDPEHTLRMGRALAQAQKGSSPILVTSTKNSGHWSGSTDLNFHIGVTVSARIWSTVFSGLGMSLP